jgi:hypothetical protein
MADLSDINIGINVETGDVSRGIRMFDNMKKKIAQMQLELRKGNISNKAYNRGLAQMYQELGKVTGNTRQAQSAVMKYSRSIQQATDEQLRFTSVSGKGMRRMEVLAQQAGYQIGDLAVQIQSGTNAAVALGQQGSQLLGFFGPYGAIAGAALAIGTGLIAPFIRAGKEVEDFQKKASEALEDIKARIAKLKGEDTILEGYNESIAQTTAKAITQLEKIAKIRESGRKLKQPEEDIDARLKPILNKYENILALLKEQQAEKEEYLAALKEEETLLYQQDVIAKQREKRITDFFKVEQQMHEEIAQSRVNALLEENKARAKAEADKLKLAKDNITVYYKEEQELEEQMQKMRVKNILDAAAVRAKVSQAVLKMTDQEYQMHLNMQAYIESRMAAPEDPIKHANAKNKATEKAIDLTRELTDAQKQQVAIADSVSGAFGDFFMGLVDGTTSAKDAFRSMAADIIQQLYRILVVEQMVQSIAGAITGAFTPASAAGTGGTVAPPRRPTGVFGNYDGGGYTGSGPRSGGLDGKGGFMAMLHPRETVIDHTKGQSAGGTVVNQVFNISANTSDDTKRLITQTIAQASPAIINQSVGAVMNQRRRGGAMKSAFG